MEHPIDTAARVVGSAAALAKSLGVTRAAVWQWKVDGRKTPVEHCLAIERLTNGVVTRRDLRPDDFWTIWPDLSRPIAKEPANV